MNSGFGYINGVYVLDIFIVIAIVVIVLIYHITQERRLMRVNVEQGEDIVVVKYPNNTASVCSVDRLYQEELQYAEICSMKHIEHK